jgi:phosphoserine phosphatase
MSQVLSLIAADAKSLGASDVDAARYALDAVSVAAEAPAWLAPAEACDIFFEGEAVRARDATRAALGGRRIDVNVVPASSRRKKLLIADMDSTMIGQECIDELAAEVGLRAEVAAITERAMRGEIDFAPALRERVALMKGLRAEVVERVLRERIEITPGALVLIATMRAFGAHTALVSGGFSSFVEPVGKKIGFHETRANILLSEADVYTGCVGEPILGAEAKVEALLELSARLGLSLQETLAIGDGANDSGMIQHAGLGVGFHAKPKLRKVAGATIDHANLRGVLYLQGFRREEFVER